MIAKRLMQVAALVSVTVAGACGKEADEEKVSDGSVAAADQPASGKRTGANRNACDLLTIEEVSAAAGEPVIAKEIHRETGRSDCQWDGKDGLIRMSVVGYWTGGKEGWEILAGARGAAKAIIQKEEGVSLDSVVKSGPVPGLGDKAFFSDILPSLVLKDNVLLEIMMPLIPNPEARFRPLMTKALARL
jgi:hypothetical protein